MKIETALSKFLVQLEADGRSQHTIRQYTRHIRLFCDWTRQDRHSEDLSEITHEDVALFLSSPKARSRRHGGVKRATSLNTLRSSLRVFFRYSHEAGYISHNPGRLIRRAICGNPPPRSLSDAETTTLMATLAKGDDPASERDHALIHLLLSTGIRIGSALAIDIEDVDFEAGQIRLRTNKRNREEVVFLNKKIEKHLERYMKDRSPSPLFISKSGSRVSRRHIQRRFGIWLERAGIKRSASVHWLRHTMATNLYRRTKDIFLVKEALRHSSIASTLVYAKADEVRLRRFLQA